MFTRQGRLYSVLIPVIAIGVSPVLPPRFAAWRNPGAGAFGRGAAVYGPYGGAGGFAAYNPRTGAYARGGAVYGPCGSEGFAWAWNPPARTYAIGRSTTAARGSVGGAGIHAHGPAGSFRGGGLSTSPIRGIES